MKYAIFLSFLISFSISAQKTPKDFGFQHLTYVYQNQPVDIIIQSKKGDENKQKPLFFWCQGSLPQPVIKYDENGIFQPFPFDPNDFLNNFHLVIVGKPGIPIISDIKNIGKDYSYTDKNGKTPKMYTDNNYLDFYVERNNWVLETLLKEKWVSTEKIIAAGHSEGSTVAAKMTSVNKKITHLIYSGGNPYGRILSLLAQSRFYDSDNKTIDYWKDVVENKNNLESDNGDSYKCTYDFSFPTYEIIQNIKIPVLITYGTKDWNAPYNDLFYVESIRKQLKNCTFIPYIGLEHNYFPVNEKMEPNHSVYNWENVGKDWKKWLTENN